MGILSPQQEFFGENPREVVCEALQGLGVDAHLAPRGRPEEKIDSHGALGRGSIDLIDIGNGPIRWVSVRFEGRPTEAGWLTAYHVEYGVPDPRVGEGFPKCRIESVLVKSSPVVGRMVDLYWEGEDFGLGVISRLNNDHQLKKPIVEESWGVRIKAIGGYNCWIISTPSGFPVPPCPSEELWNCLHTIARHLLAEW